MSSCLHTGDMPQVSWLLQSWFTSVSFKLHPCFGCLFIFPLCSTCRWGGKNRYGLPFLTKSYLVVYFPCKFKAGFAPVDGTKLFKFSWTWKEWAATEKRISTTSLQASAWGECGFQVCLKVLLVLTFFLSWRQFLHFQGRLTSTFLYHCCWTFHSVGSWSTVSKKVLSGESEAAQTCPPDTSFIFTTYFKSHRASNLAVI